MRALLAIVVCASCSASPAPTRAPTPPTAVESAPGSEQACATLHPEQTASVVLGTLPRFAPPLSATDLDGKRVDLAGLRGRVVLVAFEASWLTRAQTEVQELTRLAAAIGPDARPWSSSDAIACVNPPAGTSGAVSGTISFGAGNHLTPGTAIFVIAKRATGGPPVAVDKVIYRGGDVAFELDDSKALLGGQTVSGDLIITGRYDQDGDALTKQPGDLYGEVHVTAPAYRVKLLLDKVVR